MKVNIIIIAVVITIFVNNDLTAFSQEIEIKGVKIGMIEESLRYNFIDKNIKEVTATMLEISDMTVGGVFL